MLTNKRILLIIGGGIAAFKALDLIRRLRERGAHVRCVLTPAAAHFVTPLSVAALSGDKVYQDLFSLTDEAEMGHIELSRDADLLAVVPATADLLAKLATGQANDLASTLLLATDKKVLAAPAMNLRMWLQPATKRNVAQLREDGVLFVGPVDGSMACGEYGPGRMSEPLEIVAAISEALKSDTSIPLPANVGQFAQSLRGKRVVVTSGPTHEPIDPVRYIANRSSGRQGHAIATAAANAGAEVTLVSGPVTIDDPAGVRTIHIETAQEMLRAVKAALPADIFIAAAAVADWRVTTKNDNKIKKGDTAPVLQLAENPDILATIAGLSDGRPALVVGFAAETQDVTENALKKLAKKKCDVIVANDVGAGTDVMGGLENTVHIVTEAGVETWPKMEKSAVASRLVGLLSDMLERRQ
ncbi:bifunctional phosphopantothenoylcysteine decarboxylase/phosphopantothenate--cysteine ligase CoaBC [Roseiarcaceae bacterium H3SJ34-1]|uniref:bifunctional phosphopantothenoylcysteine decarboxylase/phosphopantothenate--cysteine ligase CoaBC n=1 Tax=Terripilifer ovatus TaxID=3032367 RepID=UPI003AB957BD|nr:bifunctional phosphopantothenoylcysteine decarboxylase/phosphopantothenate--cysteine ligase CoaBC [Roseiarcaceae bacterium H3SJ34-1]